MLGIEGAGKHDDARSEGAGKRCSELKVPESDARSEGRCRKTMLGVKVPENDARSEGAGKRCSE